MEISALSGSKLSPAPAVFLHYCKDAGFNLFPFKAMSKSTISNQQVFVKEGGLRLKPSCKIRVSNTYTGSSDLMQCSKISTVIGKGYAVEKKK